MGVFSWCNKSLLDDAVISTNSELTAAPIENLLDDQPSLPWIAEGLAGITIDIDMGAVVEWDWFALLYHNGSSTGTVDVSYADTQGGLGASAIPVSLWASSGLENVARPHALKMMDEPINSRWVRLVINDGDNESAAFQAGALVIGKSDSFSRNFEQSGAISPSRNTSDKRTLVGSQYPSIYSASLGVTLTFKYMEEDDYISEWDMVTGFSGIPQLFVLDPDATNIYRRMIYGDLRPEGTASLPFHNAYQFAVKIVEWP